MFSVNYLTYSFAVVNAFSGWVQFLQKFAERLVQAYVIITSACTNALQKLSPSRKAKSLPQLRQLFVFFRQ